MFPPAHWPATTVLRRLMSVLLPLHENYAISCVYFRHRTPRIDFATDINVGHNRLNTQSLDSRKTMSNPVNSNERNRTSISDVTSQRTVYLNRLPLCYVANYPSHSLHTRIAAVRRCLPASVYGAYPAAQSPFYVHKGCVGFVTVYSAELHTPFPAGFSVFSLTSTSIIDHLQADSVIVSRPG